MNALKVAESWRRLDECAWNPYRCLALLEAKGDGELRKWSMRLERARDRLARRLEGIEEKT